MQHNRQSRATRRLGAAVGGGLLILGSVELIMRLCGSFLGFVPSAWTVLMPVLIITLVVLTIISASRQSLDTGPPAG